MNGCHATSAPADLAGTKEGEGQHAHHGHEHRRDAATSAVDPVCGMQVDPATALRHDHDGSSYFFCSAGCREKFKAMPEKYLKPRVEEPPAPAGAIYTCPMHPEVRQVGPGSCPKCGMALEPAAPTLDDGENHELKDMTRRRATSRTRSLSAFKWASACA